MSAVYHSDMIQGSKEWLDARRGVITASEMKLLLTPTLALANNDKSRLHIYELLAQRIGGHTEPCYISDDMLRGEEEEVFARELYAEKVAPVKQVGFITNDKWGFTLGYSPDGLVGEDGLIEVKSRRQKYQVQAIVENQAAASVPDDFILQVQTGLLVSERKWVDFVSYSGGLPMVVIRAVPDQAIQAAILKAASSAESTIAKKRAEFERIALSLFPTKRRNLEEMFV